MLTTTFDPAAELDNETGDSSSFVHIRVTQRNGRKCVTTVENMDASLDLNMILKTVQRKFCCGGSLQKDENNVVIELLGDQRANLKEFLLSERLVRKNKLKIHGY